MRVIILGIAIVVLSLGCGGDGLSLPEVPTQEGGGQRTDPPGSGNDSEAANGVMPGGPAEMNTIRIGDEVFERTLPMTSGQCFLYEADGTLPTSATVWGTVDDDDGTHFAVSYGQNGDFEAQVDSPNYHWLAGTRNGEIDELSIELDFDAQIIKGSGIFTNFLTGESAEGTFEFMCEGE